MEITTEAAKMIDYDPKVINRYCFFGILCGKMLMSICERSAVQITMRTISCFFGIILSAISLSAQVHNSPLNPIKNPLRDELRNTFQNPPREYSTGPLWTWNDMLTEEQIRSTLQDLAGQHVKQVWVHPRFGLMTPYLSEDWFRLWKIALDEAETLDMNVWIYDENSYPSGFAGGLVPDAMPESRGMALNFKEVDQLENIDENIWYVFEPVAGFSYKNITATAKKNGKLPLLENGQKYLIAKVQYTAQGGGWFGGKYYVDLFKKGVTEKFIEITHEAYRKHVGNQFGKRIPGVFTDEAHLPGVYAGSWVSWNEEIPERFEQKFGYSLINHLPSLHKQIGDWKKVRHNYHVLLLDLFIERWSIPVVVASQHGGIVHRGTCLNLSCLELVQECMNMILRFCSCLFSRKSVYSLVECSIILPHIHV